jgi:hypothetical protein
MASKKKVKPGTVTRTGKTKGGVRKVEITGKQSGPHNFCKYRNKEGNQEIHYGPLSKIPKIAKNPESAMIVPFVSTKTFPDYVRMMIESYTFEPEVTSYIMNDLQSMAWENKFDNKVTMAWEAIQPTKYFIQHASDMVVAPHDIERMKNILDSDPMCAAVGIYPIGQHMSHSKLFQDYVIPTRVVIWDAQVWAKYWKAGWEAAKEAFNGFPIDYAFFVGMEAIKDGYHTRIDGRTRPWHVPEDQFKTMWINPTHSS